MWFLLIVAGLQLAAAYHVVEVTHTDSLSGEVCYRIPLSESAGSGPDSAASSSSLIRSSGIRVDYSLHSKE